MNRADTERITSPGIGIAVVAASIAVVLFPGIALLVLGAIQVVAGIACLLGTRIALNLRPRATGAAWLFTGKALFWFGMAGLFVWMHLQQASPA